MTETFTTSDGLRLAYYVDDFTDPWKQPDTVLLLHAAMGSSKRWFQWVPPMLRHYRVVRLDFRGHGASQIPRPGDPFSLDLLVGDVVALLDRLGAAQAHVVGSSAGGYVAQKLALQHPRRVKTLALYASMPGLKASHAPTWIPKIKALGMKRFLAETIEERFDASADPELVKWFIEEGGERDPDFISRWVLHMCTHYFMDEIHAIQAPTLIVAPGGEKIGQATAYDEMKQRISNSELIYYDTPAHNITDGYAQRCVADLMDFLQRRGR